MNITTPTPVPPSVLWNATLVVLLSLEQNKAPPVPTSKKSCDAPYLVTLLAKTPQDPLKGFRQAPWITPSITTAGSIIKWSSLGTKCILKDNTTLSFCPGSIVGGRPLPYFITNPGQYKTQNILVSIANSTVFQRVLHSGGTNNSNFGNFQFPRQILAALATAENSNWPPNPFHYRETDNSPPTLPRNLRL